MPNVVVNDSTLLSSLLLPGERFEAIRAEYEANWNARLGVLANDGGRIAGTIPGDGEEEYRKIYAVLIREAFRWGEARFDLLPDGCMVWVAPLLLNTRLLGGIMAHQTPDERDNGDVSMARMNEAAEALLSILERENLTNAPLLRVRRAKHAGERNRAEAIHTFKDHDPDFRVAYMREESALVMAVKKGEPAETRKIATGIALSITRQTNGNAELIKGLLLLLAATMSRTAMDMGCNVYEVLDSTFRSHASLTDLETQDDLIAWLEATVEHVLNSIHRSRNTSSLALLQQALKYMHDNLHKDISRDDVALSAHLSPAHFTHLMRKELKDTFTNVLARMRVNRAAELLARTRLSLNVVAIDCGFRDQSYFTKVFRKYMHKTPRQYRMSILAARDAQ